MRVLLGPLAEARLGRLASEVAERLAGPGGTVVSLRKAGISDLSRRLTQAEVVRLREAILGLASEDFLVTARDSDGPVGYVCAGSLLAEAATAFAPGAAILVAVTDHANLTWRSPLTGPNDDLLGPRFPSMTGVYAPEIVTSMSKMAENMSGPDIVGEGMIVVPGIVTGVRDDGRLSDHEAKMAAILGCAGVSSELAPVTIVAAHLRLRVAAAVLTRFDGREMPGGGS